MHTSAHIHPLLNANRHHHPWWWSSSRLSFGLAPRRPLFFCCATRLHGGFIRHPDGSGGLFEVSFLVWLTAVPRSASHSCDSLRSLPAAGQTTTLTRRCFGARRFTSAGLLVGLSSALLHHSGRRAQRAGLSRTNLARFCHRGVGLKNCAFLFPREYVQSRNLPDFGIPNSRTGNCPCRTACRPAIESPTSEKPLHAVAVLTFPNHQPGRGKSSTHPAEPFCSPLVCPAIPRIRGEPPAIPRDRGEPPPSAALRPAIPRARGELGVWFVCGPVPLFAADLWVRLHGSPGLLDSNLCLISRAKAQSSYVSDVTAPRAGDMRSRLA